MFQAVSGIVNIVLFHYKAGNINWPLAIYVTLVHLAACIGLTYLSSCHQYTLLLAFVLWPISSFGITAGSHRLWAHRSYTHNWHHKYPFDYAASELGISHQFNPTKLLIDTWCAVGWASDRKRGTGAWAKLRGQREAAIYSAGGEEENAIRVARERKLKAN